LVDTTRRGFGVLTFASVEITVEEAAITPFPIGSSSRDKTRWWYTECRDPPMRDSRLLVEVGAVRVYAHIYYGTIR